MLSVCISTWSNDENVPVGTFSQDAKYVVACTFRDTFDVKCLPSGAKRMFFFFFFGTDERTYGTFYVTLVLYVSPQFWLEMSVSGAITLMLCDVLK